jgi:putative metallohydrolase (TIGR04338 family)
VTGIDAGENSVCACQYSGVASKNAEQLLRYILDQADTTADRTLDVFSSRITVAVERRMALLKSVSDYIDRVPALTGFVHGGRERWSRREYRPAPVMPAPITSPRSRPSR